MNHYLKTFALLVTFLHFFTSYAQDTPMKNNKMQWWEDAKFGMFIHWGVYSVPAGVYNGKEINGIGEWIMNRGKIPVTEYQAYAKQFNMVKYDPEAWVKMANHPAGNLTDGDPKNSWQPDENDSEIWVEMDLGKDMPIAAISLVEPWHPWNNRGQKLELQYLKDGEWQKVIDMNTNGTGFTQDFTMVKAQIFRIKFIESKEPLLNEWVLYRGD
ncbi:MAG: alpha-L-fucosidase [Bacteroidales bacterium]